MKAKERELTKSPYREVGIRANVRIRYKGHADKRYGGSGGKDAWRAQLRRNG